VRGRVMCCSPAGGENALYEIELAGTSRKTAF
jgi:hypothetical protein